MIRSPKALNPILLCAAAAGFLTFGAVHVLRGANSAGHPIAQSAPGQGEARTAALASDESQTAPATVQPDELAKELSGARKPIVVCVGPHALYEGAHVPGAIYHGPASTPDGLNGLRQWAEKTSRDANIVVYCGCCPLTKCPNIRPALDALRDMGFTRVRELYLPQSFYADWIQKNLPVEKGG